MGVLTKALAILVVLVILVSIVMAVGTWAFGSSLDEETAIVVSLHLNDTASTYHYTLFLDGAEVRQGDIGGNMSNSSVIRIAMDQGKQQVVSIIAFNETNTYTGSAIVPEVRQGSNYPVSFTWGPVYLTSIVVALHLDNPNATYRYSLLLNGVVVNESEIGGGGNYTVVKIPIYVLEAGSANQQIVSLIASNETRTYGDSTTLSQVQGGNSYLVSFTWGKK